MNIIAIKKIIYQVWIVFKEFDVCLEVLLEISSQEDRTENKHILNSKAGPVFLVKTCSWFSVVYSFLLFVRSDTILFRSGAAFLFWETAAASFGSVSFFSVSNCFGCDCCWGGDGCCGCDGCCCCDGCCWCKISASLRSYSIMTWLSSANLGEENAQQIVSLNLFKKAHCANLLVSTK